MSQITLDSILDKCSYVTKMKLLAWKKLQIQTKIYALSSTVDGNESWKLGTSPPMRLWY